MNMMDSDHEPTPDDERRMQQIHTELERFYAVFCAKHGIPSERGGS
jgi:hypothetical protein